MTRRVPRPWCSSALFGLAAMTAPFVLSAQIAPTAILDRLRANPTRSIDFHARAMPDTVFVGQQTTYQVAVLLSAEARARLRRNPEFLPPELRGLLSYELGGSTRVPPRDFGGATFEAHVFQRALFPVAPGVTVVPAPQLSYALPQSSSYFSREDRYVVRAESARVIVKPLPVEGRPADFTGAVGAFRASVRLDSTLARVGDPVVLTMRVQGTGNVRLLPRPPIEIAWASAVPGTERVQIDSSGPLVRGFKEFDWILTPAQDGVVELPALEYVYFDPFAARYVAASTTPESLTVRPGALVTLEEGASATLMELQGANAVRADRTQRVLPWWWIALVGGIGAPLLALLLRPRVPRTVERAPNEPSIRTTAELQVVGGPREEARRVRRELQQALARVLGVRTVEALSPQELRRALRYRGVSRETTTRLMALVDDCDATGYASAEASDVNAREMAKRLAMRSADLLRAAEKEALVPGVQPPKVSGGADRSRALLVLATIVVGSVSFGRSSRAQQGAVDRAVDREFDSAYAAAADAYRARAFRDASQRFRELVATDTANTALLIDWGTAAWAEGDTVSAVVAFHRAARRDPINDAARSRMLLLPAGARGGDIDAPALPFQLPLLGALVTWCALWVWAAWRWRHRRRLPADSTERPATRLRARDSTLPILMSVSTCVAAAVAYGAWQQQLLTGLAVVERPETLRVAPGSEADAMGGVSTGDVVRITDQRESWARVRHADGRQGWLPTPRLVLMQRWPESTAPSGS